MADQGPQDISWDSLCDECAGILRIELVLIGAPSAYAVTCEAHGLVGMMPSTKPT